MINNKIKIKTITFKKWVAMNYKKNTINLLI